MDAIVKSVDAFFTNPLVITSFILVIGGFLALFWKGINYLHKSGQQNERLVDSLIKLTSDANNGWERVTVKLEELKTEQIKTQQAIHSGFAEVIAQSRDNFEEIYSLPDGIPHPCQEMIAQAVELLRQIKDVGGLKPKNGKVKRRVETLKTECGGK